MLDESRKNTMIEKSKEVAVNLLEGHSVRVYYNEEKDFVKLFIDEELAENDDDYYVFVCFEKRMVATIGNTVSDSLREYLNRKGFYQIYY